MTVTFNKRSTDPVSLADSDYYMYAIGAPVRVVSFPGAQPTGKVAARYTSDEHNHSARPHKRYVVVCGTGPKMSVIDVAQQELDSLVFEDMS